MRIFYVQPFVLLILFCATNDIVVQCKKGGSSGGGSSPSRGSGIMSKIKNTFGINRNRQTGTGSGGMQPPRPNTGFQQRPSSGGIFGRKTGVGAGVGVGAGALGGYGAQKWAHNAGRSNYKSSNNKAILSGTLGALAGGYVGYKLGKTVAGLSRPRYYNYQGRDYWYGSRYYQPTPSRKTCIFEVGDSTPNWSVRYDDNQPVREVIFECFTYEQCCEMSCCRAPSYVRSGHPGRGWGWFHTLLLFFVLAVMFLVCIFAAAKLFQSRNESQAVRLSAYDDSEESRKPFNQPDVYPSQLGYYPAAYPAQPGAAYPSQAPYPAGPYSQQPPPYPNQNYSGVY